MISWQNTLPSTTVHVNGGKKVFFRILNLCMVNAFILYNEWCKREGKPKIKQLLFRRNVIKQIIAQTGVNIPSVPQRSHQHLRLIEQHFPSSIPQVPGSKRRVTRAGVVCWPALRKMEERAGLGKRKRPGHESSYECAKCSVSLCYPMFQNVPYISRL